MTGAWETKKSDDFIPAPVRDLISGFSSVSGEVAKQLGTLQIALKAVERVASDVASDPKAAALKALVLSVEAQLEALLTDARVHAIVIPIQKQPFGPGVRKQGLQIPETDLRVSSSDLDDDGSLSSLVGDTTRLFIDESPTAVGGTQGFWRTLLVSTLDGGDFNKPNFDPTFAVVGTCILFGSESYAEMQSAFDFFSTMFNFGNRADLAGNTRPVPMDLKAQVVPFARRSGGGIGVLLSWDAIAPVADIAQYTSDQQVLTEIVVARSEDNAFREYFNWAEVFATDLSDDRADLPISGKTKIIARLRNDGIRATYTDTDADLKKDTTYYYAIAYRYEVNGVTQPMGSFSNAVRVRYTTRPTGSRRGVPPDWWVTPSIAQLVPLVESTLSRISLVLNGLLSASAANSGIANMLRLTLSQLDRLVGSAEETATEMQRTLARLNSLTTKNLVAVHATTFDIPEGGMDKWLSELARRLSDPDDASKPQFSDSALVAGFVLVGGAPDLSQLQALLDLLKTFFGGGGKDKALVDAIAAVDATLPGAEEIVFDAGMVAARQPVAPVGGTPTPAPAGLFDESMNPADSIVCTRH